jgi:hypothetical protein
MLNLRHLDDSSGACRRRILHRPNQRVDHLRQRHESETLCSLAFRRDEPCDRIQGDKKIRPAVSWAEHVPWPEDRGSEPGIRNGPLPCRPRRDVGMHHGRGMRHAHIHQMCGPRSPRGLDRRENRRQIDLLEFRGLRRRRMRRSDEVHDGVGGCDDWRKRRRVERVAHDCRRTGCNSAD